MRKKLALSLAAIAGALSLLVPAASSGAPVRPACVVVDGPSGLHIQIGYAPNGPSDCQHLP